MSLPNRKVPKNFPCECGHPWEDHDWAGVPIGDEWCNGSLRQATTRPGVKLSWPCPCQAYLSDNLKYLEKCLKRKGKLK